ncbi:hypothetical protein [Algicella marina]|uniref:Uncharacterized protein n=1 Tax=Algicella marina TaxID=2683284 RepID=A0A6P1T5G1_9RHOB|nr:hypothetical protein [Algicella marina]QHQ35792.1 hypothetical protein GO499_11710 [Algicella marina]
MRWMSGLLVLVLIGGCTTEISETERRARCVAAFERYDREVIFARPTESAIVQRVIGDANPGPDFRFAMEGELRGLNCYEDLDGLAEAARLGQRFDANGVGRLAEPEYLHAGMVRSNGQAAVLKKFFTDLGYRVRDVGAPKLGRRIFVGPLDTVEARRGAEQLARMADLATVYTVTRLPWP